MSANPTVLVVEDDDDDFFFTERVLRRHFAGLVLRLGSGHAAIAYLAGQGEFSDRAKHPMPEIVLVDLKMEQGSGHEVLDAIRRNPPSLPPRVFVLTGSNEPRDRELVRNSGVAAGYIVKPLTSEHVAKMLGGPS